MVTQTEAATEYDIQVTPTHVEEAREPTSKEARMADALMDVDGVHGVFFASRQGHIVARIGRADVPIEALMKAEAAGFDYDVDMCGRAARIVLTEE